MSADKYKPVTEEQIETLKRNGCIADDWIKVHVSKGFNPDLVVDTVFKGTVKIGSLEGEVETPDGVTAQASIFGANLNNVTVGDNCMIRNTHSWIMNMDIGSNVVIVNLGRLVCTEESSFGNGSELEVLNEGGGRELKITTQTSAQIAYLNVIYRDRKKLIEKLDKLAEDHAGSAASTRGYVGDCTHITNSGRITNVNIGEYAQIDGISTLENGTVLSSQKAPTKVTNGVTADNFIFQQGSNVSNRAVLGNVLVGEGTKIGSQFSSENSVFFANSQGYHSEACSVFGGPYTVTHHKSTLLIAGLFSFYNAGSGTNQSNHMYKLGPVHQGILERGCKTGSFSYMLWPSRVAPFTAVIGKHYSNFDVPDFPFSYIDENNGKSVLIPGMNLFTVGTFRDGAKWPTRDGRTCEKPLDKIIFDVMPPYTGGKMIRGRDILTDLYEKTDRKKEFVTYNGINIKRLLLRTGKRFYTLALSKYFGDVIVKRAEKLNALKLADILDYDPEGISGESEWVDVSGLLCAKERLQQVITGIEKGDLDTFEKVHDAFEKVFVSYEADEWNWLLNAYKTLNGCELKDETKENLEAFLTEWKEASVKIFNMVLNDAEKEFDDSVKIGFGIDGNREEDFKAVRGEFEENSFIQDIKSLIEETEKNHTKLVGLL
jgi:NDP-sugar pyrophosphorylase family protein